MKCYKGKQNGRPLVIDSLTVADALTKEMKAEPRDESLHYRRIS